MMDKFKFVLPLLLAVAWFQAWAEDEATELNCTVEVNADKVGNANKDVFNDLKEAVADYMNTTKWTDAQFSTNEKIECTLFFTIATYNSNTGQMIGDLQIQSKRPVYNSSYTTTIINFKDTKIDFTYESNQELVFNENDMVSNLTAILNFYAYLIIALDFDTFAPKGGDPYYERAANVVRLADGRGESGWKAFEDSKNRNAVLTAYTESTTDPIRHLMYEYHRQGLDQMAVSVDKGRQNITKSLDDLTKVYEAAPMSVCLSMFKDAKLDELVNIYSKASMSEKEKVYDLLYAIYPADQSRLSKIKEESR